jgi:hypothetical protein
VPSEINLVFSDEPFEGCAKRVEITLTDTHRKQKEHYTLGVLSAEDIYKAIDAKESLAFDRRYIESFSLADYRASRGLSDTAEIQLHNLTAEKSYWEGEDGADFSHAKFTGEKTSFRHCVFGDGPLSFFSAAFRADETDFSECQFGAGTTNFQYTEFNSKSVRFDGSHFKEGDIFFVNSTFGDGLVSFKEVDFGHGKADFHYTKFGDGNLTFDKSKFGGGEVNFKRVDFGHGKVDFKRINFGDGEIDFSEASFKSGKVLFRSCIFGKGHLNFQELMSEADFIFDNAEFGSGSLSFLKASARTLSFHYCHFDNYVDLRIKKAHRIDLSYTIVRDVVDMMPTDRAPVQLEELTLNGMRNLGSLYIDWEANMVLGLISDQADTTNRQKSEQFLILKETYNLTGRYADEDRAYIWYKRYELRADVEAAKGKGPIEVIWANATAFFKWLLFDKIGLYATEPLRVLFSVSVIYTLFSFAYLIIPLLSESSYIDTGAGETLENMHPFTKAFYFSAITFLTVGYGDFYPAGMLRILASVEGYVGVFLMGYFSVAFVRKVLR